MIVKEEDKVLEEIDIVFNEIIKIIEQQRVMIKETYRDKCENIYKDFHSLFNDYYKNYSKITKRKDDMNELDFLYTNYNDFDVVKEYLIRDNKEVFSTYCEESN